MAFFVPTMENSRIYPGILSIEDSVGLVGWQTFIVLRFDIGSVLSFDNRNTML